jgi:O-antigen/teichoic acid export membrane protein
LLPRYLGDDGLGRLAIAWTIGSLVGTTGSLGLASFVTRKVATDPARAATYAWGGIAVVILVVSLLGGAVLATVILLRPPAIDIPLAAIMVASALVFAVQGVIASALVGLGRNARFAWSTAASTIVGTAAGLTILLLGGGVYAYAAVIMIAGAGAAALMWWSSGLPLRRAALAPALLRELVAGGLPFLAWNVVLRVRSDIDVVLVGLLLRPGIAGWLAAAYRIIGVTVFIPTVITTPLMPALSRSRAEPEVYRSLLRESLATVLLLTVPVSAFIFALAPTIPTLLGWPESLNNAVPLMMLLAFQQTLVGVDMVLGVSLVALGLERPWLRVAIIAALFNPLVNLVAIPLSQSLVGNGGVGAAIVELATERIFLVGAIRLTPRHLLGADSLVGAGRTLAAGLVLLLVATLLQSSGPLIVLAAGGAAYAAAAFAFGAIRPRQLRALQLALRPS